MPTKSPSARLMLVVSVASVFAFACHADADCPADLDGDGVVSSADLTGLLAEWGACPPKGACPGDLDGNGEIGAGDLAILLSAWGDCPAGCPSGFAWKPGFGEPVTFPSNEETAVYDFEVFDFGNGPVLVAGGNFRLAGGVPARSVASWNGSTWSPVGAGIDGSVLALEVFDDGSGPKLYAGGSFSSVGGQPASNLARWDGAAWVAVPGGVRFSNNAASAIWDMTAFNDGTGLKLWICGEFNLADGVLSPAVATFNGSTWGQPGGLVAGPCLDLHVHDDGAGEKLYVGGRFRITGQSSNSRVAVRTQAGWTAVGTNPSGNWGGTEPSVWSLLSATDPGSGQPLLVAAGGFTSPGLGVAWWNGATWSSNTPANLLGFSRIAAATYPGSSLNDLVVSGPLDSAYPDGFGGVARRPGGVWGPVGGGLGLPFVAVNPPFPMPWALKVFDDGSGPRLFAGGSFLLADGTAVAGVAAWDGSSWSEVGGGISKGVGGLFPTQASTLVRTQAGGIQRLVAGGRFTSVENRTALFLAEFDGTAWSALGGGTDGPVFAALDFDDGSGPQLYVGGTFGRVGMGGTGTTVARAVARWDGDSWSPLGTGIVGTVSALAAFDHGSGPAVYAGGSFVSAGGSSASRIARWDGTTWSPLGSGVDGPPEIARSINAMTVFDDGSGPGLFVGGVFTLAGGNPAANVAKWNGSTWSPLGSGINGTVSALAVFDDGGGPALYAGGAFSNAGGVTAYGLARWKDGSWQGVPGLGTFVGGVQTLKVFDDGSGPRLAVGGVFSIANGAAVNRIGLWDGAAWNPLSIGTDLGVRCLETLAGPDGPTLVIGGDFTTAGGILSRGLGWWQCTK